MARQSTNSSSHPPPHSPDQYESLQHFDKMTIDLPWNDEKTNQSTDISQVRGEKKLSDKMKPASTSAINGNESLLKEINDEIEKIPNYLTKHNKSFQQMIHQALSEVATTAQLHGTFKIQELRNISALIHRIMVIQTYQLLWTVYLKSGLGQLIMPSRTKVSYSTTFPMWPKEAKTMASSNNMKKTNEHEVCLHFVNHQLHGLEHQLEQYQIALNTRTNTFPGYTLAVRTIIESYIEQNLHSFRTNIEHQVQLVQYDYHIRALKLEYLRCQPNEYQEQLMKQICQNTYAQETSEQEYQLLKQQIAFYNLPEQSFDSSSIAHSSLIDSMEDGEIRQALLQQYKDVAVQSREGLFALYVQSAEDQRQEFKRKFEVDVQKMFSSQRSSNDRDKLSARMMELMHKRCSKITERIKCIYQYRAQSFLPTS